MIKLGWMSTGGGEGSRGFLRYVHDGIERGELDARIQFVFSNRERHEAEGSDLFFDMVKNYDLPLVTLSSKRYRKEQGGGPIARHRIDFHTEVMRLISVFEVDICVLAGYLLITSTEMARRYRMINVHAALPGGTAGLWQQVNWKLIEDQANESGVTVHVATDLLDEGPTIGYCKFPIRGSTFDPLWHDVEGRSIEGIKAEGEEQPLFKMIRLEGLRRERPVLLQALRHIDQTGLTVAEGQVFDATGMVLEGKELTCEVEECLRFDASGSRGVQG